ncbi:DUF2357 domain-containing protein [Escherichia coli]|uniref:DUF2357 domain-containing protein n=1 Tax=Escherichia coli TaxID=562 RepID=UPI00211E1F3B|nr:DUF2357 domain-containing protein [Escherichia coli]UUP58020.1 DUF2357 domain-containing protein [Escherichia coli]
MKIKISIWGGKRQGDAFELPLVEARSNSSFFILEDESIEISFSSDIYYDKISLLLYENEVEPTIIENHNDLWTYKWQPKRLGRFSHECFFHNYYGVAELMLEAQIKEQIKLFNFQPIEVLAKKINAERVEKMLSFLAGIDSEALCSFFRVTRRKAGYKHGDTPAEILLEQIENTTEKTSTLVKKIITRPITKLSTREKYVYPDNSTNVDDLTLSWLCNNADELFETDYIDNAVLEHNNNLYGARKLIEYQATEDSDVYENQVLHGFINTLIQTTSTLLSGFESPERKVYKVNGTPSGYVSFFSQIQKFQKSINERKILKCKSILVNLHSIKRLMTEKIPSKKNIVGIPTFTMKAKKDSLYLSVFKKIVDWYRFGSPDWSVQEELLSIQSIPKLFEYYSLFYIKVVLEKKYISKSTIEPTSESLSFSFNLKKDLKLNLFYEPKYWMAKHPMADLRGLVNTEGWTIYNGKVSKRSSSGRFSNRSPDFVIKISDTFDNEKFIILDAKYTYSDKAFIHYLPDLTLKYLHGLHSISNAQNKIAGLMILNPDEESQVRDFHNSAFDVFSETPAMPFLLCASVAPGDEFIGNNRFEHTLMKILDLTLEQFKKSHEDIYSLRAIRA